MLGMLWDPSLCSLFRPAALFFRPDQSDPRKELGVKIKHIIWQNSEPLPLGLHRSPVHVRDMVCKATQGRNTTFPSKKGLHIQPWGGTV